MARGSPVARCFRASVVLLVIVFPAAAVDVSLTYVTQTNKSEFFPSGYQNAEVTLDAPPGQWKLPEFVASKPAYALLEFGDRKHLMVFDFAKAEDDFYQRLFFDANGNADLTDDPIVNSAMERQGRREEMYQTAFDPVDAMITVGGKELPYRFTPQLLCFLVNRGKKVTEGDNWRNINFYLRSACAYRGSLILDDTSYSIWLGDQNGNGSFADQFQIMRVDRAGDAIYPRGDSFFLLGPEERISYEGAQTLGKYVVVANKVFEVAVNIAEGKMTLTPVTENLATLETPFDLASLEVYTEGGEKAVMLFKPGKQAPVPADSYRLLSYRVLSTDEEGGKWQLSARGTRKSPGVTARAGEAASLTLGEPFTPIVDVDQYSREQIDHGERQARISFTIRGSGKEVVQRLQRTSGSGTKIAMSTRSPGLPAEPKYKIVSGEGEVVTSGSFEYG
ncbi:MAG: hypothetical protein IT364_01550 [Candidatus Hydrogenedentes bacterium]|nr:hypothetical protein [Candidatus Hydrogenedentota bacterium]